MKVNGIIAEYNPFHKGHAYQIAEAKAGTGADATVVLMSGNYVQRGTPAILDKHIRTRMALENGADLVLELPVQYSCASAEYFSHGAVSLLNRLKSVDNLCFGSELGDVSLLQKAAAVLAEEPREFRVLLKEKLAEGFSFPKAREFALRSFCPELSESDVLTSPNNILAIEYLKAIQKSGSSMQPYTTVRQGSNYHDTSIHGVYASATAIRSAILAEKSFDSIGAQLPASAASLLEQSLQDNAYLTDHEITDILYYKLLSEQSKGYDNYLDLSEELSNRIRKSLGEYTDFSSFCTMLKTKELTYSRISRALLHILLDIPHFYPDDADFCPDYVRVLGFRRDSASLLSYIAGNTSITLLTKPADYEKVLSEKDRELFKLQNRCDTLYHYLTARKSGKQMLNEFTVPITII